MKKYLLTTAGFTFLTLGVVGIVLPLLPTTPFLLLSAGCFFRSSERFYGWIINHRLFGVYIKNYLQYRAISLKSKIIALLFLWITIIISILLFHLLWLRLLLFGIALGVSIHILKFRTMNDTIINDEEQL